MQIIQPTIWLLVFVLIGIILFCVTLYYVIKMAIKDALKEVKKGAGSQAYYQPSIPAPNWNAAQIALKDRYEKGEITIDEYTKEWNKL